MTQCNHGLVQIGRRDFIKTTAIAGMASTLPASGAFAQEAAKPIKPRYNGKQRKLLFLSDNPTAYESLINSIKGIREFDFVVDSVKADYKNPKDILKYVQGKEADLMFMCLPRSGLNSGIYAEYMGALDMPVVLLPINLDLIMLEADVAATFRSKGTTAMLANSEAHAMELVKFAATPMLLEGKRALIFGRPYDSTSVPVPSLNADYIYRHTGMRLEYRPIEELKSRIESVDMAKAQKEAERWKKEALKVTEASDQAILDACKLYVVMRSIVDQEGLSGISIDCLSFTFSPKPMLPYPCLSFTRLRDEGFAVPCEADVCGMVTSMFLQEISRKPSFFYNVSSVDTHKSTTVLRHCVAPVRFLGKEATPLPYIIRDYHGMGGVTPEVQFPIGAEVTLAGFSKDLKNFLLWPGRIQEGVKDTNRPSFENAPPNMQKMRRYCTNRAEVKVKEINRFLQNIAGIHQAMVAGAYADAIQRALQRMNVTITGPVESTAPEKA
jgi:L-fucose isomerase-like protein